MDDDDHPSAATVIGRIALLVVVLVVLLAACVLALVALWPSDTRGVAARESACLPTVDVSATRIARGSRVVVSSSGFRCGGDLSETSSATIDLQLGEIDAPLGDAVQLDRTTVQPDGSFRAEVAIPASDLVGDEAVGAYVVVESDAFRCGSDSCLVDSELTSERLDYVPL